MKEEVVLRILVKESLNLELRLQRYGEKKLWGPICNFWMWLWVYLELFSKIRGASNKYVDCGMIMEKGRGLYEKWLEYLIFELFSNRKWLGLGPWLVDQSWGGRSMVPPRTPQWPAAGARRTSA
jgi:hypothetical protein